MNRLKSNHQDLELNTIIYWQPMKVVKYRINVIEFHCVRYKPSLQAGSSVENGARSKYKGLVNSLVTKPLYFDRAPFSTEEPACRLL